MTTQQVIYNTTLAVEVTENYTNDSSTLSPLYSEPVVEEEYGDLAMPLWEAIMTASVLGAIILVTLVGNILVILSVFTYKPLRIVQNFFIVSLAVADLTVAVLVLPFNVAYQVLGRWQFGVHVCKMWLTCDVLCCTASILNLCAIALDRYWAITDPINYAQKRTFKRVLLMIGGVWVLSCLISSPPLIGWNDWGDDFKADPNCALTNQQGYVIYSSLGSFYIPLFIMTTVYVEIFIATKRRLRERAKASKLNAMRQTASQPPHHDQESVSSETNHNEHPDPPANNHHNSHPKKQKNKKKNKKKSDLAEATATEMDGRYLAPVMVPEDSITDNQEPTIHDNHTTSGGESPRPHVVNQVPQEKKSSPVYQFIEEKQRISLSKERRAARTLGIIMGVFVVCWLPFFLMYVILPFCPTCEISVKWSSFITWLGYVNSALNPIIYTIFNMDFRRAFKKLLHMKA